MSEVLPFIVMGVVMIVVVIAVPKKSLQKSSKPLDLAVLKLRERIFRS